MTASIIIRRLASGSPASARLGTGCRYGGAKRFCARGWGRRREGCSRRGARGEWEGQGGGGIGTGTIEDVVCVRGRRVLMCARQKDSGRLEMGGVRAERPEERERAAESSSGLCLSQSESESGWCCLSLSLSLSRPPSSPSGRLDVIERPRLGFLFLLLPIVLFLSLPYISSPSLPTSLLLPSLSPSSSTILHDPRRPPWISTSSSPSPCTTTPPKIS